MLSEVVAVLERRQAEFLAWVPERCHEVESRARALQSAEERVEGRIASVEARVSAVHQRVEDRERARAERATILQAELETLRQGWLGGAAAGQPDVTAKSGSCDRIGTALVYLGCLILVWLVLWQIGLALGLG